MGNIRELWENIFIERDTTKVSWYQADQSKATSQFSKLDISKYTEIIDIGRGSSALPDELWNQGYKNITVVDISPSALNVSQLIIQLRIGKHSEYITWFETNILDFVPSKKYGLWYDRAVFHFLSQQEDRQKYTCLLEERITSDGYVTLGGFAKSREPDKCSGLDVHKLSKQTIDRYFSREFDTIDNFHNQYVTPSGFQQNFYYSILKRKKT